MMGVGPLAISASSLPVDPSTYPSNIYDFAEFTYAKSGDTDYIDTDSTQVNQVGLTYSIKTTGYNGPPATNPTITSTTMGSTLADTTLQTDFSKYTTASPGSPPSPATDFNSLRLPPPASVSRIVSPKVYLIHYDSSDTALNTYFDQEIGNFFTKYTSPTFTLDYPGVGTFTGKTATITDPHSNNQPYFVLQLTDSTDYPGVDFNIYEPAFAAGNGYQGSKNTTNPSWLPTPSETSGEMVFAQDGVFSSGFQDPNLVIESNSNNISSQTALNDMENAISSAFNRGIATSMKPDDWTNPTQITSASAGPSGSGSLAQGTYYYVITAVNSAGETVASPEVAVSTTGANQSVTLNWNPLLTTPSLGVPGVSYYNIYRGTSSGQEQYIGFVTNNSQISSYSDSGSPPVPSPPSDPHGTNPPFYYPQSGASNNDTNNYNYYAAFLHQTSIMAGGHAYAIPYDDQGVFSTDATVYSNSTNTQTMTVDIALQPWSTSRSRLPSPSTPPSSTPTSSNGSPSAMTDFLYLEQDQFAWTVDSILSLVSNNPLLTQATDQMMILLNDFLHLDNSALGTGRDGLQSAIKANPLYGTLEGLLAEVVGYDWAANLFAPQNQA